MGNPCEGGLVVCTVPLEASSAKLFPETELKVFCGCFFFLPCTLSSLFIVISLIINSIACLFCSHIYGLLFATFVKRRTRAITFSILVT